MPPAWPENASVVPVGRPRHVTHRADARQLDAPLDVRRLRVQDRDLVRALGVHDERELAAVRRPIAGRVDEADRVEVRVARRTAELLDDLAGRRVADEQVDAEQISAREEREQLAVGADRRREVVVAAARQANELRADAVRMLATGDLRQIHRPVRRGPVLRQRIAVFAEHADERRIPADAKRRAVDLDDRAIAPAAADVRPQRLAVAVREEARVRGELLDRRELVRASRRRASTSR